MPPITSLAEAHVPKLGTQARLVCVYLQKKEYCCNDWRVLDAVAVLALDELLALLPHNTVPIRLGPVIQYVGQGEAISGACVGGLLYRLSGVLNM